MKKKGITPIISVVLLLMMTVGIFGAAYFWLNRFQGNMQTKMESLAVEEMSKARKSFSILSIYKDDVSGHTIIYFKNTGSSTFTSSELQKTAVIVDGKYIYEGSQLVLPTTDIAPGDSARIEINDDLFDATGVDLTDQKVHNIKVVISKWSDTLSCGPLDIGSTSCSGI